MQPGGSTPYSHPKAIHLTIFDTFDHVKAAFFKRFIENDEWTDFIKMGQLRQEP